MSRGRRLSSLTRCVSQGINPEYAATAQKHPTENPIEWTGQRAAYGRARPDYLPFPLGPQAQ